MESVVESEGIQELNGLTHKIIGAAMEVHRCLGPGFLESVYEGALCLEMRMRDIPFLSQVMVPVYYKGELVGEGRLDMLVDGEIVVELKSVETLAPIHSVQLLSYLKATNHRVGLLINFNAPVLKQGIKRLINGHYRATHTSKGADIG
jgi:GxxExxY protein